MRFFLSNIIYRGAASSPEISLTFDDGPHPVQTLKILKILKEFEVKASFFLIGNQVVKYPKLVEEIKAQDHLLANHSYSHQRFFLRFKAYLRREILATEEAVEKITGERTRYFRPPYGRFDFLLPGILKELDYQLVMWNLMPGDYRGSLPAKELVRRVIDHARPGAIIVLHDHCPSTVRALPQILENLRRRFDFLTIDKIRTSF